MQMPRRRTRFSKARSRRKTSFPVIAVVQKRCKPHYISGETPKHFEKRERPGGASSSFQQAGSERSSTSRQKPTNPVRRARAAIDYKNVVLLRKLITAEGKILPRRINKLTAKQQRHTSKAIKSARIMGLLPFINTSPSVSL